MAERKRVVVTGLGLVTSIGNTVEDTWTALREGRSGGAPITQFDAHEEFTVRFACEVKDFDPGAYLDRKEVRRTDRFAQFAIAASDQALAQSGLLEGEGTDRDRVGVIIGSGIGGISTFEDQARTMFERGPGRVSPFFIPMFILDIASGLVSMRHGLRGPNYATVSACASSAHAIGDAMRALQRGEADAMIAGGAEATVTPMTMAGFASMHALSTRNESPETASRPFDATRDGFVLGEGAGVLILETLEHARARGATILGEIRGFGQTADAHHLTAPAPGGAGAQLAMRAAIEDAGMAPSDIDYVNAHGTSTPANDLNETLAIKAVFGEQAYEMVVGSTKSMTGHTLGAAGGVEAVICTLVCGSGVIPPTINFSEADPECDLDYAHDGLRERPVQAALSNSFGFGGHNACVVVRRWDGD
ncbi:MAG TPA: beta-ketoacyl-ACP synthase II [Longimicrobiales bacterium]|nr:beta-ketoacyl-ACP synthase II [Longimicrobiales bacterium]